MTAFKDFGITQPIVNFRQMLLDAAENGGADEINAHTVLI